MSAYARHIPATLPYSIQKRTALARALMAQPSLLLLDEPASGLSNDEMDELGPLIRGLSPRMGVLLVEHHMDLVMSVCDRLVVLNFGQVIADGTPGRGSIERRGGHRLPGRCRRTIRLTSPGDVRTMLEVQDLSVSYGASGRAQVGDLLGSARSDHRHPRCKRRRQDHACFARSAAW